MKMMQQKALRTSNRLRVVWRIVPPACASAALVAVLFCKSSNPGGIPVSADPATALAACTMEGLEVSGTKRLGISVSSSVDESTRGRVLDAYAAAFSRDRRFRPVEREKLGLVLREQGLASAGLLGGEDAAKVGGVLPVDWILSAAVRRSGSGLQVSGRFLDAVNGTILHGFDCPYSETDAPSQSGAVNSFNVTTTTNNTTTTNVTNSNNTINSNNQTNINIGTVNVTNLDELTEKKCDRVHAPVRAALRNLTTPQLVQNAARLAMKIPFDTDCGQIHYVVMDTFERYGFGPEEYTRFLLDTMDGIDDVSADGRTSRIIRYTGATDGHISETEWKSGFSALLRSREPGGYILLLLNYRRDPLSAVPRAGEILAAADAGKIGRPVPARAARVFYFVLRGLPFDDPPGSAAFVQILSSAMDRYVFLPGSLDSSFVEMLASHYFQTDAKGRGVIRTALAKHFRVEVESERSHEHVYNYLAYPLERRKNGEDKEPAAVRADAAAELASVTKELKEPLCRAPNLYARDFSMKRDQVHFLLRNGMGCPGLPTVKDLVQKAEKGDWDEKVDAFQTLVQMRANARDAEGAAIHYFQIQGMSRSDEIRALCAEILGYIQTTNPQAHELLIAGAGDFASPVQDASEKALARIGPAVRPAILRYLYVPRTARQQVYETRRRMSLVQVLGRMGKSASDAIPILQVIAQQDVDSYVRTLAKAAIVNIQEDRTE